MGKTILSKLKFELSEAKILAMIQIWKWFCKTTTQCCKKFWTSF